MTVIKLKFMFLVLDYIRLSASKTLKKNTTFLAACGKLQSEISAKITEER